MRVKRRIVSESRGVLAYQKPQRRVALSVEEGVLEAVGFVAGEAVGDVDGVAGLKPLVFADHGNERIARAFPCDPIVPTEIGPSEGFVARLKLRLERERMADGVRRLAELGGNAF